MATKPRFKVIVIVVFLVLFATASMHLRASMPALQPNSPPVAVTDNYTVHNYGRVAREAIH